MSNKSKILSIVIVLFVLVVAVQLLNPVSATVSKKTIDKGVAPLKNVNGTNFYWKVYGYSNKGVVVYNCYSKENKTFNSKKTVIKKMGINKLGIKTIFSSNSSNNGVWYTKSKLSPKSYYNNVYKVKMLKNVILQKNVDSGRVAITDEPNASLSRKVNIDYAKKITVHENIYSLLLGSKYNKVRIEQYGKNKLKITTFSSDYISKNKNEKKIVYVKSDFSPESYYFNVHRSIMLKYAVKENILERAHASIVNSSDKISWEMIRYNDGKIFVNITYNGSNNLNIQTTIGISKKGELKVVIVSINGSLKNIETNYIINELSPESYYYNIYRNEMLKNVDKSTLIFAPGLVIVNNPILMK